MKFYLTQKKARKTLQKKVVRHAAKSVNNIRFVYVEDQSAVVKDGEVTDFRVNVKITFEVN